MHLAAFFEQLIANGPKETGMTIDACLETAREHGITGADFSASRFSQMPAEECAALLRAHDMMPASVHDSFSCDYASPNAFERTIDGVKQNMYHAKRLGSAFFMLVPQPPVYHTPEKQTMFVSACRECFAQLTEFGKEIGLQTTIENFSLPLYPYASFSDLDAVFALVPDLRFTYDSGNFNLMGLDELEGLQRYLDRVVYVHLKDLEITKDTGIVRNGIWYEGPALDDGFVRNGEAVRTLAANGYDGWITIEICSSVNVFDKLILSARRYADTL